ncbi:winged helix-turn-helix domain-containing protein [Echinicola salinicaeni]|uniref:winged helix-turn-helix domain-containing protein n=1 Tax=Echinicola salinicaeni TaxID=2762757 RepID=UPI001C94E3BF|nr:crosslink repair DNA glycosylase YcaQ family protein [Echinicola salinicaeni]
MTIEELQGITLESQGLLQSWPFGKGKHAVLNTLEQLGYIQIDTLSVIERAHHHTLYTRIPDYETRHLDELVKERKVFEYWFHAASYLPMRDYRFTLPQMLAVKGDKSHYYKAEPKVMQYVMDTIRAEGPKKARDFESQSKKAGSWWSWKPTKVALERLFMQGDLMICERNGMQKTFDLTENVLPEGIDLTVPKQMEFAEYLVKTYLHAYGFTSVKQITHLKKGTILRNKVNDVLTSMLEDGSIQKIDIEGIPPVFIQSGLLDKTRNQNEPKIHLLSPFDNSIIHRDRIKQLFDFDFRLECYVPKEKRQYGYFCLPILFGDTFIGRVDCKAHRKAKQFEIIHLHIENSNIPFESWLEPLAESIRQFASFNGCESLKLTKVSPSKFTPTIKRVLNDGIK